MSYGFTGTPIENGGKNTQAGFGDWGGVSYVRGIMVFWRLTPVRVFPVVRGFSTAV